MEVKYRYLNPFKIYGGVMGETLWTPCIQGVLKLLQYLGYDLAHQNKIKMLGNMCPKTRCILPCVFFTEQILPQERFVELLWDFLQRSILRGSKTKCLIRYFKIGGH